MSATQQDGHERRLAVVKTRPRQIQIHTIGERAIILGQLDDPPDGLAELRGVLTNEHQWRRTEGLG